MKINNPWVLIPENVLRDSNLTFREKIMYSKIVALDNGEAHCYAGNQYFSELLGIGKVSVSRIINSLIKKGYVKSIIHNGNQRRLYICSMRGSTYVQGVVGHMYKHNNKSNNKSNINMDLKSTLEKRTDLFKRDVMTFIQYDNDMLEDFIKYWTETNSSGTKFRREDEKFFDIGRRLSTWKKNTKNKKNGLDLGSYKTDSTGKFYKAYCFDCGSGESYSMYEVKGDSRCCKAKLSPTKEKINGPSRAQAV